MARIRTVKPKLFRHEELFEAERDTGLPLRLAFIGLFTCCDRAGRFEWRPRTLQLDILPYDDIDFSRVLDALAAREFVVKYACDGKEYGYIPTFSKHQVINNREADSELPTPCEENIIDASSTRDARVTVLHRGNMEGNVEGKGTELKPADAGQPSKATSYPEDFEAFWKAYPTDKNMPKKPAHRQWQRLTPEKRQAAIAAIPGFVRYCDENKSWYRPVYAERFLSQEKFEGYAAEPAPANTLQQLKDARARCVASNLPTNKLDRAIEEAEARAA